MRFIDAVYFLFLLTLSLDPTGFHSRLKDLLFAVLVIYGVIYCLKRRVYLAPINRVTFLAILLIPLWGAFIAYITGELKDSAYATSQVRSMLYICIFLYSDNEVGCAPEGYMDQWYNNVDCYLGAIFLVAARWHFPCCYL